jgi:hypothetical protein
MFVSIQLHRGTDCDCFREFHWRIQTRWRDGGRKAISFAIKQEKHMCQYQYSTMRDVIDEQTLMLPLNKPFHVSFQWQDAMPLLWIDLVLEALL